jgi:hypothetical protein
VDPTAVQRFVAIDVADAAERVLIEQEGFDLSRTLENGLEFRERDIQWIGADGWQTAADPIARWFAVEQPQSAEAAGVDKAKFFGPLAKGDVQMRMLGQRLISMHDNEPAGHAQMNGEDQIVLEVNPDLFAMAADFFDAHARKALFNGDRRTVKHIAAMEMDNLDDAAGQMLGQAASDSFNFGQFGHIVRSLEGVLGIFVFDIRLTTFGVFFDGHFDGDAIGLILLGGFEDTLEHRDTPTAPCAGAETFGQL